MDNSQVWHYLIYFYTGAAKFPHPLLGIHPFEALGPLIHPSVQRWKDPQHSSKVTIQIYGGFADIHSLDGLGSFSDVIIKINTMF